jgi:hypothetical protein
VPLDIGQEMPIIVSRFAFFADCEFTASIGMDGCRPRLLSFGDPGIVPGRLLPMTAVVSIFKSRRHGGRHGVEAKKR